MMCFLHHSWGLGGTTQANSRTVGQVISGTIAIGGNRQIKGNRKINRANTSPSENLDKKLVNTRHFRVNRRKYTPMEIGGTRFASIVSPLSRAEYLYNMV